MKGEMRHRNLADKEWFEVKCSSHGDPKAHPYKSAYFPQNFGIVGEFVENDLAPNCQLNAMRYSSRSFWLDKQLQAINTPSY